MTTKVVTELLAAGGIVQVVNTQTGALQTGTTTMPADDTIPQNTEGFEVMTLAITPKSATNKLKIEVVVNVAHPDDQNIVAAALFQGSTANALACAVEAGSAVNGFMNIKFSHWMTAGTTSATTFKVRIGSNAAGTISFNGGGGARFYGGVLMSSVTITEIAV